MQMLVAFMSVLLLLLTCLLIYSLWQMKQWKSYFTKTELELIREVKQKRQMGQQLEEVKNRIIGSVLKDTLTELPSRQLIEDRLGQLLHESRRYKLLFGILFLDIDHFKLINDAMGHDAGDELLKEISIRLQASIRQVDTVGRFAGDEFVILLPQLSKPETAAYVAQRFLDAISQPFEIRGQEIFMTATIGISVYPNDGEDAQTLLKNSANALHRAKLHGKNIYQFYREEMLAASHRELTLNSSMRGASLYHDFSLYYQPQINVVTQKIIALDVALHWQHPDYGLIPVHEFLRLAENTGKIFMIGEWMMHRALQQLSKWNEQNLNFKQVAVTISLRQLENPHFTYKISHMLHEFKLDPSCLILKISEGALLTKPDIVEKAFFMLKHIGVKIAIEDFGAGNVALQQLKRFPIDYIKMAPSLTQDITVNKESEAIVKMILALATSLNIIVVAEGVETQQQRQLLNELGCNTMQGHLFSDPCLAEQLASDTISLADK
jgi:diguanylate cyclase (GGDEF)-like protein